MPCRLDCGFYRISPWWRSPPGLAGSRQVRSFETWWWTSPRTDVLKILSTTWKDASRPFLWIQKMNNICGYPCSPVLTYQLLCYIHLPDPEERTRGILPCSGQYFQHPADLILFFVASVLGDIHHQISLGCYHLLCYIFSWVKLMDITDCF